MHFDTKNLLSVQVATFILSRLFGSMLSVGQAKHTHPQTYPADCRKIAAVDSHNSIGIERKENIKKIDFCTKTFLSAIYFDVIL